MSKGEVKSKEEIKKEKIKCMSCKSPKLDTSANFYANTHPLFSSDKLEICKDCIRDFIGGKDSYGYLERVQTVLTLMDRPFLETLWIQREQEWSKYIPQLSSFNQYKGLTFKDSTMNINHTPKPNILNLSDQEFDPQNYLQSLIEFWGDGLEIEQYEFLQKEFTKLINSYECDSYAMEMIFQEVSHLRLSIKKLRENSKPVDKELKTLQDLLGSANIKPVQETGANSVEQATFGTLIKKYENERPIPEPDPMWKDVDKIGHYIKIWFFGHFAKMLGLKSEDSEEYEQELKKYTVDAPEYENDEGVIEECQE
jgi:hypothetical protein